MYGLPATGLAAHLLHYIRILFQGQVLEAHAYNPSYSASRDQKDHGSKPAGANSSGDPISKTSSQKKGWWNGSKCKL
jgi:hypothetical protein